MTGCHTLVQNVKVGDTIIEEQCGMPLKVIEILPGKVGEPIGVYYTEQFKVVTKGLHEGVLKLTLMYMPEIPIPAGPLPGIYINYYKDTIILAHFPEKVKSSL